MILTVWFRNGRKAQFINITKVTHDSGATHFYRGVEYHYAYEFVDGEFTEFLSLNHSYSMSKKSPVRRWELE